MLRESHPYRKHLRYPNRFRDHRGLEHPDEVRRNRHPLVHLHRRPDVDRRSLGDPGHLHQLDDPDLERHLGDLDLLGVHLVHHPDDLDLLDVDPDDPCLGLVRTGCCPDVKLDEECPCPEQKQMGCFPGVECQGLRG